MRPPLESAARILEERVVVPHGDRRLSATLAYPDRGEPCLTALIAGPHPLLGGNAGNNVVEAVRRGLAEAGAMALTFDYGGIGDSEGEPIDWPEAVSAFWQEGEVPEETRWVEDARAVWRALPTFLDRPSVLIGYSFGCRAVWACAEERAAAACALISPHPNRYAFEPLKRGVGALLVITTDNDFSCPAETVRSWFARMPEPKSLCLLESSEHFFRGEESRLVGCILDFLARQGILHG